MTSIKQLINSELDHLDQQVLLAHCLQKSRSFVVAHPEYELTTEQLNQYQQQLSQLKQGKPLAYIIGEREFWSLSFKVTSATLIPRPETEELVSWVLENLPAQAKLHITDLGTGSGAIAIALASEREAWKVTATDISQSALEVAEHNRVHADKKELNNLTLIHSDWFSALDGQRFDMIISNPPYIDADDRHLQALSFEPTSALVAENHGLADLQKIISGAQQHLKPQGYLALEHGCQQGKAVYDLLKQHDYHDIQTHQDLAGLDRFTTAQIK